MTVAVLSESSADEAALRVLLSALIGDAAPDEQMLQLRTRGWPSVLKTLPTVIKHLHYRTTIDALLVVSDSDDSTPHGAHGEDATRDCRLCLMGITIAHELGSLTDVPGREKLKTAVGLSMPAIEAWYLCGVDATVTEAAWINGRQSGHIPYTRLQLKTRVYGTPIPQLSQQREIAVSHAMRLSTGLTLLDTWFPYGCGVMLDAVRSW